MPQFPVQIKRSGTASSAPTSLLHGELAINYNVADGKLFWKDSANAIRSFAFASYLPTSGGTITGSLTVQGDLQVQGDVVSLTTSTVVVEDKNIELGSVYSPTDETADGGGITLLASSPKSIVWHNATDSWTFNQNVELTSGFSYRINGASVLNATTLGSGVTSSSLTSVGTITTGVWSATAIGPTKGGTGLTSVPQGSVLVANAANTITALDGGGAADAFLTYTASTDSVGWSTTLPSSSLPLATTSTAGVVIVGTGLSVSSGTISIASTAVSAGSYGSASSVATFTVGADGRLTSAGSTSIAISASAITSGTLDAARLPLATTLAVGGVIVGTGLSVSSGTVSVAYGSNSTSACRGDDSRLSDSRAPTSHSHGNITNAGAVGATAGLPIITTTSGVLTTGTFSTTAGSFCQGNDSRLSDARTPTGAAGGDLTGTYPNPQIAAGAVVTADLANSAVTYAKLQNVSATDRLLGRSSAGAGVVEEVTCTSQGRSLIAGADAAAQRVTLGLGAMATSSGVTLTGDVTGSGTGSFAATLSNSGVTAGTYRSVTVDVKGRVTSGTNPTTLAGYGITDAPTTTGTGASGTWAINVSGELTGTQVGLGYTLSTATIAYAGQAGPQIRGQGGGAACMSFHRPGAYAVNFGLDTDNQLKVGGWSLGANSYVILSSANYNSYAPTLTGGGASGSWGISVTGTAASETLATVTGRGASTTTNITTTGAVYSSNWFRSNGSTGWYSEAWGGGIWMSDATYVRVYNNKVFYADNFIWSGTDVRAPIFYDSQDTAWYCDPNGTSRLNALQAQEVLVLGENLYVGNAVNASYVRMRDGDEGERIIHCNSNRIGFLTQAGGWGAWCNDDGSWESVGRVTATEFYESGFAGRIFGAKAWCIHFGNTSPTLLANSSGNVSSITYRNTGRYRVNFTTGILPTGAVMLGTAYDSVTPADSASATMVRIGQRYISSSRLTGIDYAVSVGGAYSGALDVALIVVG